MEPPANLCEVCERRTARTSHKAAPFGLVAAVALVAVLALVACGTTPEPSESPAPPTRSQSADQPCGTRKAPPRHYRHVIWIWMENKSYDQVIGSKHAPYENELARACGLATRYRALVHPSLPNYLAATGGSTFGVRDSGSPRSHPIRAGSLFDAVTRAGEEWRGYAESMPGTCALRSHGDYAVRHNPATYFTRIRRDCERWNVPLGTTGSGALADALRRDHLPAFSFVVPDLCSDTHNCAVSNGDAWLAGWISHIVESRAYAGGDTVVFLTWDEGEGKGRAAGARSLHIPLIVVSPSTPPGTRVSRPYDHYALLATTADLLGVPAPGHGASAPSMAAAFHL